MKRFFIGLLILLAAVWIGDEIVTDPGYVLIARHKIAIEMPLWLAAIGFILSVIIIYFLIRMIRYLAVLPQHWHSLLRNRQQQKQSAINDQSLFATLYQTPQQGEIILKILPELAKKNWISSAQIQMLERHSYAHVMQDAIHTDIEKFTTAWQQLPKRFKKDTHFLSLYVNGLIRYHEAEKAEVLTRQLLKRHWLSSLIQAYGLIDLPHAEHQLVHAERWLKQHPHDPDLLLTLGQLCKKLKLWGKSKDYLERSLRQAPANQKTYHALAELFEALGEPMQALQYYKKAFMWHMREANLYS